MCCIYVKCLQLRARRVLTLFIDVALRTRRALSLYKVYDNNTLLVVSGNACTEQC